MTTALRDPLTSAEGLAVYAECRTAQAEGREISDACARTIAAWYQDGTDSQSLASTGAISDPTVVYRDLFYTRQGAYMYLGASEDDKLTMDMMGTYLLTAGRRGPVPGWNHLWVAF